ncbi:septation protein A [Kushneria aurantia]|uniref:Inner membrane-spanning protein YciB n=1 Tax=Kushneria aurantia TaxID=504092 RepID=A0ABV6G329_9GAMM|nr:septation protein A [Kushneria aurantia]
MKMLLDFLPIAIFVVVYHVTHNIVLATAVLIPATVLQVLVSWWCWQRLEKMHLVTLALVVVMGGATVLLGDGDFIKWKPTVVNWLFAVAFLVSPLFGGRVLLERMMGQTLSLPQAVWRRLNLAWVLFFIAMGAVNIAVFMQFSEETWVNFKLFGMMGLTLLFVLAQGAYMARYLPRDERSD